MICTLCNLFSRQCFKTSSLLSVCLPGLLGTKEAVLNLGAGVWASRWRSPSTFGPSRCTNCCCGPGAPWLVNGSTRFSLCCSETSPHHSAQQPGILSSTPASCIYWTLYLIHSLCTFVRVDSCVFLRTGRCSPLQFNVWYVKVKCCSCGEVKFTAITSRACRTVTFYFHVTDILITCQSLVLDRSHQTSSCFLKKKPIKCNSFI